MKFSETELLFKKFRFFLKTSLSLRMISKVESFSNLELSTAEIAETELVLC